DTLAPRMNFRPAIIAMPLAGALINRLGSRMVTGGAGILFCLLFLGPVTAPTVGLFMASGFVFGMVTGSMDVAMNAHGIAVERRLGKPVMSFLHGAFSLGGLAGALLGGLMVQQFGPLMQALAISLLSLGVLIYVRPAMLPAAVDKGLSATHFGWPTRASLGLGILCFLALMGEGAIIDWGGIFLRQKFELNAGTAALGYALFSGGMAFSRFAGDRLRARFGAVRLVRWSACMMALGMAGALLAPHPAIAIAVLVFTGIGIGNIAPILFSGGGRLEPHAPGRGIAAVTTLGYAGFLAGPPAIGIAAEAAGLGGALWLVVFAGVAVALAAHAARAADQE
ncbi:MAG: MFS transporter, partial [Aestuariivirgaceae bacterium]|nr:MFS transporter [Aestuariivirgaceae bacterium]